MALTQHTKIFESLKQRQPVKARRIMKSHVTTFQRSATLRLKASKQDEASIVAAAPG